jgi:hypothetical protein
LQAGFIRFLAVAPSRSRLAMLRPLVRTASAAALLLLADGLAAQSAVPRLVLAPQIGGAIQQSRGVEMRAMASLVAEVPVGRGVSLMAEGTAALGDYALTVCFQARTDGCGPLLDMRSAAAAGAMARPIRLGPVAPYAGVSGGVARWARGDARGTAPLASMRAGVDVRVAGPFGVRADLVRRILWTDQADESPVRADVLSLGASFALRR